MIRFDHFGWQFDGASTWAVRDVSLHIGPGEFVAIAGVSGSGKSTLALAMCGLLMGRQAGATRGDVTVAGQDVASTPLHEVSQHIALVQQNPETHFATLTVSDEIAFGLENRCAPREEIRVRIGETLERLSITHLRDRDLATLSGGEKQRVAVASILAGQPEAIVLDEPTASLDPDASRGLFRTLADLGRSAGLTVIIIEHKLAQLLPLKPRLVLVDAGRVTADVSPDGAESAYPEGVLARATEASEHSQRPSDVALLPSPLNKGGKRGVVCGTETDSALEPARTVLDHAAPRGLKPAALHRQGESLDQSVESVTPSTGDVIIDVSQLEVVLGDATILTDINLEVCAGEVIAILGPSGGGKSTLLSSLVGLIQPTRGTVRLFGSPVSPRGVSRLARQVGYVFQNADHQLVTDTVWGEALYATRAFKILTPTIEEEADRLLDQAGIADRKQDHPYRLSWGEKRRLNLISAVLHEPRLLLLDEPFAGQDWENAVFLLDVLLRRLTNTRAVPAEIPRRSAAAKAVSHRESARAESPGSMHEVGACLMVTHDPRIVLRCCTRLLFVSGGQIAVDAPVPQAFRALAEMGYDAYVPPEFLAGQRESAATGSSDGP